MFYINSLIVHKYVVQKEPEISKTKNIIKRFPTMPLAWKPVDFDKTRCPKTKTCARSQQYHYKNQMPKVH